MNKNDLQMTTYTAWRIKKMYEGGASAAEMLTYLKYVGIETTEEILFSYIGEEQNIR